jgi:hypothetical protein
MPDLTNDRTADNQKAISLKAFFLNEKFTTQQLDVVLSASGIMYSSAESYSVFTDLIRNRYLNTTHFPSIVNEIKDISDENLKSEL